MGKGLELVWDVGKYRPHIVGLTSRIGSETNLLERDWTLFYSGVAHGKSH